MSAVTPLKAHSARDSFAKLVKLLTHKDVKVEFRGYKPRVETRGDKIVRMVLPELNDNPSKALLDAMHGYLDHECGHIFFTPFKRMADFAESDPKNMGSRFAVTNIIEDIRLEKLLPRDLPGTKENLERMYGGFIEDLLHPPLIKGLADPNVTDTRKATMFMVPAFRALAGQTTFQRFMDDNGYWPHIAPLLVCLPDLPRQLRTMETFDDVEAIVEAIIAVIRPPSQPDEPGQPQDKGDQDPDEAGGPADQSEQDSEPDDADGEGDDADGEGDDADDADGEPGGDEDDQGEGHGDGDGFDDGEGDEDDDEGSCSGQDDGSDDHMGDADADDEDGNAPSDEPGDDKSSGGGKNNTTITDALKQLEPTQRQALYAYKKKRLAIDAIAEQLGMGEEETKDVLREARRELKRILDGDSK